MNTHPSHQPDSAVLPRATATALMTAALAAARSPRPGRSAAQIEASRRNGAKSRGPKTRRKPGTVISETSPVGPCPTASAAASPVAVVVGDDARATLYPDLFADRVRPESNDCWDDHEFDLLREQFGREFGLRTEIGHMLIAQLASDAIVLSRLLAMRDRATAPQYAPHHSGVSSPLGDRGGHGAAGSAGEHPYRRAVRRKTVLSVLGNWQAKGPTSLPPCDDDDSAATVADVILERADLLRSAVDQRVKWIEENAPVAKDGEPSAEGAATEWPWDVDEEWAGELKLYETLRLGVEPLPEEDALVTLLRSADPKAMPARERARLATLLASAIPEELHCRAAKVEMAGFDPRPLPGAIDGLPAAEHVFDRIDKVRKGMLELIDRLYKLATANDRRP